MKKIVAITLAVFILAATAPFTINECEAKAQLRVVGDAVLTPEIVEYHLINYVVPSYRRDFSDDSRLLNIWGVYQDGNKATVFFDLEITDKKGNKRVYKGEYRLLIRFNSGGWYDQKLKRYVCIMQFN